MKRLVLLVLLTSAMLYSDPSQWAASEINLDDINLYKYVIKADGQEREFFSFNSNAEEVLEEEDIALEGRDYLSITYKDDIYYVQVIRRQEYFITEVEEIPFSVEYKNSMNVTKGFTKTIQEGKPGLKEVVYKVVIEEGSENYREHYSEVIIKEPQHKITLQGQRSKAVIASRKPTNAERILAMEASAYTHTGSRTFTGIYPEVGTIAVDPKVIPLGTQLWVEGYGYGIAQDTGKAIRGNKLDVFMETKKECLYWGRRRVKVYVLPQ